MLVIEYLRAAARRDLRIAIRQHRRDQAHIVGESGVDVAVKNLGNAWQDPAPGRGRALGVGEVKFSGQVTPSVSNLGAILFAEANSIRFGRRHPRNSVAVDCPTI